MTIGEVFEMIDKRKAYKNKYRIKVSYGSSNKEDDYRFDLNSAMREERI